MPHTKDIVTVETLHIKHGNYLLKCLRYRGIPEQECEDIRQDIYLKLLKSRRIIYDVNITGLCSKIARDAAADWFRKQNHAPETVSSEGDFGNDEGKEINAKIVADWQVMMGDSNSNRINQAIELAQIYECATGVTIYEILAYRVAGFSEDDIKERYGVDQATISRWLSKWHTWINKKLKQRRNR